MKVKSLETLLLKISQVNARELHPLKYNAHILPLSSTKNDFNLKITGKEEHLA